MVYKYHSMTSLNRYRGGGGDVASPTSQPRTHCTRGWVGLGADQTGIRSPDRSARSESLYGLRCPGRYVRRVWHNSKNYTGIYWEGLSETRRSFEAGTS